MTTLYAGTQTRRTENRVVLRSPDLMFETTVILFFFLLNFHLVQSAVVNSEEV